MGLDYFYLSDHNDRYISSVISSNFSFLALFCYIFVNFIEVKLKYASEADDRPNARNNLFHLN